MIRSTREAERLRELAEEKSMVAEGKAERVEHAFEAFRAQQRKTPEAALHSEIARLTHCKQVRDAALPRSCRVSPARNSTSTPAAHSARCPPPVCPGARQAAEQKAVVAARAKGKYKEAVRALAAQLAAVHRSRAEADARAAKMLAVQQSTSLAARQMSKLRAERKELRRLTEQLAALHPAGCMLRSAEVDDALGSSSVVAAVEAAESADSPPTEAWVRRGHCDGAGDDAASLAGSRRQLEAPLQIELSDSETEQEGARAAGSHDPELAASLGELRDSLKMSIESLGAEAAAAAVAAGSLPHVAVRASLESVASPTREQAAAEVQRLLQERADLLRTGVYSKDDRLIKELDRCIASLS